MSNRISDNDRENTILPVKLISPYQENPFEETLCNPLAQAQFIPRPAPLISQQDNLSAIQLPPHHDPLALVRNDWQHMPHSFPEQSARNPLAQAQYIPCPITESSMINDRSREQLPTPMSSSFQISPNLMILDMVDENASINDIIKNFKLCNM